VASAHRADGGSVPVVRRPGSAQQGGDGGDGGLDGALAGLPKPITSAGGAAGSGTPRYSPIPCRPTPRSRAAAITAASPGSAGSCATAWNPAASPVSRTPGACRPNASTSA